MERSGLKEAFLQPLSGEEIDRIDASATRILEQVGIVIDHPEIQSLLAERGCPVDSTTRVCKIPRALLDEWVARAPSQVTLCGRQDRHAMRLGSGAVYARVPGGAPGIYDLETRQWRRPLKQDVADVAKVTDALDHVSGVSIFPVVPMDVPITTIDVHAAEVAFRNTSKHLFYVCHNTELIEPVIAMGAAVAGGYEALEQHPLLSALVEGAAPLRLLEDQLQVLLAFVQHGLPVMLHSHPIAGLTAPVTLAGELVITHAEILALVAIAQLVRGGTPVIYGMSSSVPDMRSGMNLSGAVEIGLLGAAVAQMAHARHLPCSMSSGTDAKLADVQSTTDRLLTMLPPILAGIDMVNITTTNTKLTFCLDLLVIDEEVLAAVERYVQGIRVNDETLAVDLIARLGPGASYILDDHTRKHHRQELQKSKLLSRDTREAWETRGAPDLSERARQAVRDILRTHQPVPLDEAADRQITAIRVQAVGG